MSPFSVESALDAYVQNLEETREPDGTWHPSAIFGCARQALYAFRGTPQSNPPDARSRRVFRVGHILHEFIQAAVSRSPAIARYYYEVKIADPLRRISGHTDGLKQFRNGVWEVDEYKSINSMAFKFKDLPKPDHKDQASVYLRTLREFGGTALDADGNDVVIPPLGDDLNRIRITYVSKDDLKVEEHIVLWSDAKADKIDRRLDLLEDHLEHGTLPPRLPDEPVKARGKATGEFKRAYLCSYCPYLDKCWTEDPA